MPLLDRPGPSDADSVTFSNGISNGDKINAHQQTEHPDSDMDRRQRIVVVGLGMVAISFMYVDKVKPIWPRKEIANYWQLSAFIKREDSQARCRKETVRHCCDW